MMSPGISTAGTIEMTDTLADRASFPSAEEIKATIPDRGKSRKFVYIGAAVGLAFILFMAIYFPLTKNAEPPASKNALNNDGEQSKDGNKTVATMTRTDEVLTFLSTFSDDITTLQNINSPQYKAALWMATSDPLNVTVSDAFLQRYALVCFYYSTAPWTTPVNFLSAVHECNWNAPLLLSDGTILEMGVGCNNKNVVESITIVALGLAGTVPGELALLTSLKALSLDYNVLTGLSDGLGDLTLLDTLTLTNNRFKDSIPPWLGNLTSLSAMLLSSNNFEGPLPFQLQKLTKLERLDLDNNHLVGTLENLVTLSRLAFLDIYINNFTLSDSLATLTNLEYLNVGFNQITQPLPTWIGFLTALQVLVFSNNEFSGELVTELQKLTNLRILALDDNKLVGGFDVIEKMTWLEELYMEDNVLTGTITDNFLLNLTALQVLDLSNNVLDGVVARSLLRKKNLTILDLSSNNLTGNVPSDLPETFGLKFLSLQDNIIEGSLPDTISNFGSLTHLDFSINRMTGTLPTTLGLLTKLEYLFLAKNPDLVPGPVPDWVANLTMLQELSLKGTNRNGTIPEFLGKLTNLVLLDLDQNRFTGKVPTGLGELTKLWFLLVGRNKLTGSLPTTLAKIPSLIMLLMDENNMTGSVAAVCGGTNKPQVLIVDCVEIICGCCTKCCADTDENCNDSNLLADYEPIWENGYQRDYYNFSDDLIFVPSN